MVEQDQRSSLRHILADDPAEESPRPAPPMTPASAPSIRTLAAAPPATGDPDDKADKEEQGGEAETPVYTSTTQTTRRNANGSVSSVYSGNKIRHLKKEDGYPLWRKDIQYDFLHLVFNDEQRVFTRYSDGDKGHTFAEIYVDAMAKSSKCSKILKEKLAQDFPSAITMAMVCLLVNVGRMNTTLNFFPEMRAQLRTYHSIPALQAHQDPNAYKQLQDAPRLKSILKGATEDTPQPGTLEDIRNASVPRTNPVNLIFVLSQYAPKISELHFNHPRDFFDLVMRSSLSSKSRATAFLWLMWWYLESDFSRTDALANPFGAGCETDQQQGTMPIKVPPLDSLTEEQAALENVDTPEEKEFGEQKRKERIAIVASEPSPAMTALKRARKERSLFAAGLSGDANSDAGVKTPSRDFDSPAPHDSSRRNYADSDYTRSPSPPVSSFQAVNSTSKAPAVKTLQAEVEREERSHASPSASTPQITAAVSKKGGPGRGNWSRNNHHHHPLLPTPPSFGRPLAQLPPPAQRVDASTLCALPFLPDNHDDDDDDDDDVHEDDDNDNDKSNLLSLLRPQQLHIPTPSSLQYQKRNRPLTSHQQAVSDYRRVRINQILDTGIRRRHLVAKRHRHDEGILLRAWKRMRMLPSGWDSEDEGTAEKGKEDAKDKEENNNSNATSAKGKAKEEEKAAAALRRAAGGVRILAGFALPLTDKEFDFERHRPLHSTDNIRRDDVGEEAKYLSRAFSLGLSRLEDEDMAEGDGRSLVASPPLRHTDFSEDEKELQALDDLAAATTKPRQERRTRAGPGTAASSRKKGGGAGAAKGGGGGGGAKSESMAPPEIIEEEEDDEEEEEDAHVDPTPAPHAEDEEMAYEGEADGNAELDDDDRELLGEVDSDDEEDEDGMDEDS